MINNIFESNLFLEQKALLITNYLSRNAAYIFSEKDLFLLVYKAIKGKNIVLKWGIDPTYKSMHIGHLVSLNKIKEFLFFFPNSEINIILGTGTALLHDPNRKKNKNLTLDEALKNSIQIQKQIQLFFKKYKKNIKFIFNHNFLEKINWKIFLSITSKIKLSEFVRKFGDNITLSNAIYPIFQAYDSIMIGSDIEFGGSDQVMNVLCGRDSAKYLNMKQQVCFLTNLIQYKGGKMSKSIGTAIYLELKKEEILYYLMKLTDQDFFRMMYCFGYSYLEEENINITKKNFICRLFSEHLYLTQDIKYIFDKNLFGNVNIDFLPKNIFSLLRFIIPDISNSHIRRLMRTNSIYIDNQLINESNCKNLNINSRSFCLKYGKKTYTVNINNE